MTMMLALIAVFLLVVLVAVVSDLRTESKNNEFLNNELIKASQQLAQMTHAHREALERIEELELARKPLATAAEIVKEVAPRRLTMRRSLSEQAELEGMKHNTQEQKHLDTVAQIEKIGIQKLQPKEKT
jgi:Tfp pilus assembly protein PilN